MAFQRMGSGSSGGTETVLWTNPSPTSTYSGDAVTLSDNMTNYTYIKIVTRKSTNDSTEHSMLIPIEDLQTMGVSFRYELPGLIVNGFGYTRGVMYLNQTTIQFGGCYSVGSTVTNHSYVIPYKVIGIK